MRLLDVLRENLLEKRFLDFLRMVRGSIRGHISGLKNIIRIHDHWSKQPSKQRFLNPYISDPSSREVVLQS